MASFGLICPFLTDNPVYAYGVEFGILYEKMQSGIQRIQDYFCLENQEQILLLANRLGWRAQEIQPWGNEWFWRVLERISPGTLRAGTG